MKRTLLLFASMLVSGSSSAPSRDQRTSLLPQLHAGQTLTYLIRYQSSKNVKTESNVALPLAPTASQTDTRGLLRIEVLHLQPAGDRFAIHARGEFLNDHYGVPAKPAGERSKLEAAPLSPEGNPVEFTISAEGLAEKITGLDSLTPEQQQIWQEWLARFAIAWAIPSSRAKIGDKWKVEQPEPATSPIAALSWTRDSYYVRNEPCSPAQLSSSGEASFSNGPMDNCAVLLTSAKLVQKSSPPTFRSVPALSCAPPKTPPSKWTLSSPRPTARTACITTWKPRVISRFCCSPKLRGRLSTKASVPRVSWQNPRACMAEYNESFCHAWQTGGRPSR